MKKLLLLLLLWPSLVFGAAEITLEWNHNTESDLVGYRLYERVHGGTYTFGPNTPANPTSHIETISVGTNTVIIQVDGDVNQYLWVLTAFDTEGESGQSNEVSVVPARPGGFRITIVVDVDIQ